MESKPVLSDEEIIDYWTDSCDPKIFGRRLIAEFAERKAHLIEQIAPVIDEMAARSEKRGELERTAYREGFSEGLRNAARIVREETADGV